MRLYAQVACLADTGHGPLWHVAVVAAAAMLAG